VDVAVDGYDLVMVGILAVTALLGYFKGMVWQIAWIAGIVASSYVSLRFGTQLAPFFGQQAPWNRFIAMLALYAATSIGVWLVFRLVSIVQSSATPFSCTNGGVCTLCCGDEWQIRTGSSGFLTKDGAVP
jgi:hypothetical protein